MINNKKLRIVVVACLLTLSSSLQAGNWWTNIRDKITAPLRSLLQSTGQEAAKGAREEFEPLINQVFEKLGTLIDGIDIKVKNLIVESGKEVNKVLDHGTDKFKELENQLNDHVNGIINSVDAKYHVAMRETFKELNTARAEAIVGIRAVIADTDSRLENRINQVTLATMQALTKVDEISKNFTPGKFRTDLVDPLMQQLTSLEQDIFNQLNKLIEKAACTAIGSIELINEMLNKTLEGIPLIKKNQCASCGWMAKCHVCCDRVKMAEKGSPTDFEKYRLRQCYTVVKLENMSATEPVQNVRDAYGDLHILARLFYCSGMAIQSEPMMEEALSDAVEYHELWKLWKQ